MADGRYMFKNCHGLREFSVSSLPSLVYGENMFRFDESLETFTTDAPLLISGDAMFDGCTSLTTVESSLNSLQSAVKMF